MLRVIRVLFAKSQCYLVCYPLSERQPLSAERFQSAFCFSIRGLDHVRQPTSLASAICNEETLHRDLGSHIRDNGVHFRWVMEAEGVRRSYLYQFLHMHL
jgi:hypothetical protein